MCLAEVEGVFVAVLPVPLAVGVPVLFAAGAFGVVVDVFFADGVAEAGREAGAAFETDTAWFSWMSTSSLYILKVKGLGGPS